MNLQIDLRHDITIRGLVFVFFLLFFQNIFFAYEEKLLSKMTSVSAKCIHYKRF